MSGLWPDAVAFVKAAEDEWGVDAHEPIVAALLAASADDQGIVRGLGKGRIGELTGLTLLNVKYAAKVMKFAGFFTIVGYDLGQSGKMLCRYQLHIPKAAHRGAAAA